MPAEEEYGAAVGHLGIQVLVLDWKVLDESEQTQVPAEVE